MKNDSDFYSGHKTLLKISIYQFNKTSSGARPFSFGESLITIPVLNRHIGNR